MNPSELLSTSEKGKILEVSEQQKIILIRRKIIEQLVQGDNDKGNIKPIVGVRLHKEVLENSKKYKELLEKEGFFLKKQIEENNTNNEYILNEKEVSKIFSDICSEIYIYTKNVLLELNNGISNIEKIKILINGLNDLEKKLILCKSCKRLDYFIKERYNLLILNLTKLIKILNNSQLDIVDYYTNKNFIINLLNIITNSSKKIINDLNRKN